MMLVIITVGSRSDLLHPFLMIEIPSHGLFQAFTDLVAGLPTQLILNFLCINCIPPVVSGAVLNVAYQVQARLF